MMGASSWMDGICSQVGGEVEPVDGIDVGVIGLDGARETPLGVAVLIFNSKRSAASFAVFDAVAVGRVGMAVAGVTIAGRMIAVGVAVASSKVVDSVGSRVDNHGVTVAAGRAG